MKKIITSLALAFCLNATCSEKPKIGITILSYGDIESNGFTLFPSNNHESYAQKIQKTYTALESDSSITLSSGNTNPCLDMVKLILKHQQCHKIALKGSPEICSHQSWISLCSTLKHESSQEALVIQSSSTYQEGLKKLKS
ncbi:MAG: hypothetical protein P4L31_06665 [Candidatus Babeliales bacterium]|nr:hypothetical protein [Candidatus Babeliales bacterium]